MKDIAIDILNTISKTISDYKLINNQNVLVAYSGGIDSFFTAIALQQLGYNVKAVCIDIGYNVDWTVALSNIDKLNIPCETLNNQLIRKISPKTASRVDDYFSLIKSLSKKGSEKTSVCTPCYNAKIMALKSYADFHKLDTIVFGHHGTDSIASLLKSYYLYIDRWHMGNSSFSFSSFNKTIEKDFSLFSNLDSFVSTVKPLLLKLLAEEKIGTDESIKHFVVSSNTCIVRPLFNVFKGDIISYFSGKNILFQKNECMPKYRKYGELTARELIDNLLATVDRAILNELLNISYLCLKTDGTLLYNARNNRAGILGGDYKSENVCNFKL